MRGEAIKCDYCGQLRLRNKEHCPRCSATEGEVLNMPYEVQCAFCKGQRSGMETDCPGCGAGEIEEQEQRRPYGDYFCSRPQPRKEREYWWMDEDDRFRIMGRRYDGPMVMAPVYYGPGEW